MRKFIQTIFSDLLAVAASVGVFLKFSAPAVAAATAATGIAAPAAIIAAKVTACVVMVSLSVYVVRKIFALIGFEVYQASEGQEMANDIATYFSAKKAMKKQAANTASATATTTPAAANVTDVEPKATATASTAPTAATV